VLTELLRKTHCKAEALQHEKTEAHTT